MTRSLKKFCVFFIIFCIICFMDSNYFLLAGPGDKPHQTHMADIKGPGIKECTDCHTAEPQGSGNVNWNTCNACHSPGGIYDGVNDSNLGAINNWGTGQESLIYNTDGTLKAGKEKWCATCHDQSETGMSLIDDFEVYTDNIDLRDSWKGKKDARPVTLMTEQTNPPVPVTLWGKFIRVNLKWVRSSKSSGKVKRIFSAPLDLSQKDYFCFYMKVQNRKRIKKVKVKLKKYPEDTWCKSSLKVTGANGFNNKVWNLVSLPRASFKDPSWGMVSEIQFVFSEKNPTESLSTYVDLDEIGCDITGPNVMGNGLTWGYDITGHKMYCTQCHDPRTKHIDGNKLPIIQYVKYTENPTNFRFRTNDPLVPEDDRPTYDLQLPYTEYVPGAEGSFALCYRCHDEAAITTSATSLGEVQVVNTNFREEGNIFGASERNLHYYHVVLEQWSATCVLCHNPHGMPNPAMTRKEMGNLVYVDENNCEITDTEDWDNPDLNIRGIQAGDLDDRFCFTCHMNGVDVVGQCPGGNNQYADCSYNWGCYDRIFKSISHSGGMEFNDECKVCHNTDQIHTTHIDTTCTNCHELHGGEMFLGNCWECHN